MNGGRNKILYTQNNRSWEPHVFFQDARPSHAEVDRSIWLPLRSFHLAYTETKNILSNFDTDLARIVVANQGGIDGHGNIRTDYSNFCPTLSDSLIPSIDRTVIRGGFGMTYAPENTTSGSALVKPTVHGHMGALALQRRPGIAAYCEPKVT